MADEENLNIEEQNVSKAQDIKNAMKEIVRETNNANKELQKNGEMLSVVGGLYGQISRSASKVSKIQSEAAKSSKATADAVKEQENNQNKVRDLNIEINKLYSRAKTLTGDARDAVVAQARNLTAARDNAQDLADIYGDIADDAAKLDQRTAFFTGISDVVSDIPGLRKLSGPFKDAAKAARQTVMANSKGGKQMSVLAAGAKGFANSAMSAAKNFLKSGGYVGLIAMGISKAVKLFLEVDKATSKTAKSLDISKKEAAMFAFNSLEAAENVDYMGQRLDAAVELAGKFADATGISSQNLKVFNHDLDSMSLTLGLSDDQVNDVAMGLLASGQNAKEFRNEMLGSLAVSKEQQGVNITTKALMQETASASAQFRLNSGMSAGALGKAAVQARKVGLSFAQLESISSNILDFESSIEKEMTAQLMTGKSLNLANARMFAMKGDLAGVAAEIAKQEAVQEAFATNNVMAQKAIADSIGISVDELAKMHMTQQALERQGYTSEAQREEHYQQLRELHGEEKALEMIGDKEFERLQKQKSLQEKINLLIENMKTIFMKSIAPTVEEITGALASNPEIINNAVQYVKELATSLLGPEGTLMNILNTFTSVTMVLKGIGQIINAVLIQPFKVAYHSAMAVFKAAESAFYAGTLRFGKAKDAAKEAADHTALAYTNAADIGTGIIAGIGTMSGVEGLNATGISDAYKSTGGVSGELNVKDFVLKPMNEDTITMAGGTKLGGNVEALLEKLIHVVSTGGNVYLDGTKVGSTLVLNSKLSN